MPDAAPSSFPRTRSGLLRVASVAEQNAVLAAYPPATGRWEPTGRVRLTVSDRIEEHVTVRDPAGEGAVVRFDVSAPAGARAGEGSEAVPGATLDRVMRAALDFARAAGPLHPGALPRFPVPSEAYPGRVAVPLALLAVDAAGRRGLFGPDRVVVLEWPTGEAVGVGDAPGFDPDRWPPPRLGDWPPPSLADFSRDRLEGAVARFGALWERLLASALAGTDDPHRADEATEALALLARLDPPAMVGVYRRLSPRFWHRLSG